MPLIGTNSKHGSFGWVVPATRAPTIGNKRSPRCEPRCGRPFPALDSHAHGGRRVPVPGLRGDPSGRCGAWAGPGSSASERPEPRRTVVRLRLRCWAWGCASGSGPPHSFLSPMRMPKCVARRRAALVGRVARSASCCCLRRWPPTTRSTCMATRQVTVRRWHSMTFWVPTKPAFILATFVECSTGSRTWIGFGVWQRSGISNGWRAGANQSLYSDGGRITVFRDSTSHQRPPRVSLCVIWQECTVEKMR
jgi:hypothetical protein